MRFFEREPVRYVIAGGLNTATSYGLYLLLLPVTGWIIAYSISFVFGIFFAYYLSARLVFRRSLAWRHAVQYPLVYILQYGIGITLITLLVADVHINAEFGPPLVIMITLPFTFLLSRWIIKREKKNIRGNSSSESGSRNAAVRAPFFRR